MKEICREIQEQMSEFILGALPAEKVDAVRSHISGCGVCREYLQGLEADDRLLGEFAEAARPRLARLKVELIDVLARDASNKRISSVSIGRMIMRSRITKLAVAGVMIACLLIGIHYFSGSIAVSSKVYAMSDVPGLLRSAKTLHIKGFRWCYDDDPNFPNFTSAKMVPLEHWVDLPNLRQRSITFMSSRRKGDERRLDRLETILDGNQLQTDIHHTQRVIWFNRGSRLNHRLRIRQFLDEYASLVCEDELEGYQKVGREMIDGAEYDMWECDSLKAPQKGSLVKLRCWLSPESGTIARIQQWYKPGESAEIWRPTLFIEKIERDIPIPAEGFAVDIPEDYKQNNTPETAPLNELSKWTACISEVEFEFHICFTLEDGSVIVGWKSWVEKDENQEEFFRGLEGGGEFPTLPAVLEKLALIPYVNRPYGRQEVLYYEGRHLAYTKKDGRFIEWGIYVPIAGTPGKQASCQYAGYYRLNNREGRPLEKFNPVWGTAIAADEFDSFVLEAMAELSDKGAAAENLNYESVRQLVSQIRESLTK